MILLRRPLFVVVSVSCKYGYEFDSHRPKLNLAYNLTQIGRRASPVEPSMTGILFPGILFLVLQAYLRTHNHRNLCITSFDSHSDLLKALGHRHPV
ncbi:hypothetical protein FF1_028384 [Malus domestica]